MKEYKIDNVSDTLITKILLGTTGQVPAYDTNAKKAMKACGICMSFGKRGIKQIYNFAYENKYAIKHVRKIIKRELGVKYPPMKIVDMYLWQRGLS